MEKKYKLKTNGQRIAMPCTKEQWEVLKPELDKIEGVYCGEVIDTFEKEPILVNNYMGVIGSVVNLSSDCINNRGRTYIDTHDKEAFLNSLRGEPIEKEVKEVKQESPFNDEYWERLYHECAVRLWVNKHALYFTEDAIREAKMLIEELKNNPLKK